MGLIKKMLKCFLIFIGVVVGIIAILVVITIINTNWHTDKFRFENFKTAEELIDYIKINFPNGSDGKPLMDLLKGAGAECELIPEEYYSKNTKEIGTHFRYQCFYSLGWLYWPTSMGFGVWISLDKNQKLIDFSVNREWMGL